MYKECILGWILTINVFRFEVSNYLDVDVGQCAMQCLNCLIYRASPFKGNDDEKVLLVSCIEDLKLTLTSRPYQVFKHFSDCSCFLHFPASN